MLTCLIKYSHSVNIDRNTVLVHMQQKVLVHYYLDTPDYRDMDYSSIY